MPDRDPRLRTSNDALNLIGQRLKQRRKTLKISQPDLIGRLSVVTGGRWTPSRIDITRIEGGTRQKGQRTITDTELVALAAVLDVDPTWLLVGDLPAKEGVRKVVSEWQKRREEDLNMTQDGTDKLGFVTETVGSPVHDGQSK